VLVFPGLDIHVDDGDVADLAGGDADIGIGRFCPPPEDLIRVGRRGLEAAASGDKRLLRPRREREDSIIPEVNIALTRRVGPLA
jgi:hypothetical protein